MDKTWRLFEQLVANLEEHLGPKGAEIKSPDRIPDKITGELREVDASIRYRIGSAPILVTIECRDRSLVQDITWLEQIKSKKESIGAQQTIVVSREGFTSPAILYARQHGLELRIFSRTSDVSVTSRFYVDGEPIPSSEYSYLDLDGSNLGKISLGLARNGASVRMIDGPPRKGTEC